MSPVCRRHVLVNAGRGALGLALAALTSTSVAACSSAPPPDVDHLRAQLALATADSELARAVAQGARRTLETTLTQIAAERTRHAQALADEISRTLGTVVATTPPAQPSGTTPSAATAPARPPTVDDLSVALRTAADSAADSAVRESGYRAGLLGSIAASCTASYLVMLPTPSAPR